MSEGGCYVLVLRVPEPVTVRVGALGRRDIPPGWLAYVGSATGPGGYRRVARHRRVATGENDTRHWHIDYILGSEEVTVADDCRFPGWEGECVLADQLVGTPIDGCGSSDCACDTHLFSVTEYATVQETLDSVGPSCADGA